MKPALKPAPKNKKAFPLKKLLCAVLLLALIIAGITAYHAHNNKIQSDKAFDADKARFAAVERDMAKTYSDIEAEAGKPEQANPSEKGCGYTSQKFTKGELICNVQYTFAYGGSVSKLNTTLKAVVDSLSKPREDGIGFADSSPPVLGDVTATTRDSKVYLKDKNGIECHMTYGLKDPQVASQYGINSIDGSDILVLQFRCSSNSARPIYPLAE